MKVGSGGNLGLSRAYPKELFGLMFYSWCIVHMPCPQEYGRGPMDYYKHVDMVAIYVCEL